MIAPAERKRLANEIWEQMLKHCEHRCLKCGEETYPLSQDHVLPIEKGGSNDPDNIQPLCMRCNRDKGIQHQDYRKTGWPWLKALVVPPAVVEPSGDWPGQLLRVRLFLAHADRERPRVNFVPGPGGRFAMSCSWCQENFAALTQEQINKSVDVFVSEAHVAWHLARNLVALSGKVEREAIGLYKPVDDLG